MSSADYIEIDGKMYMSAADAARELGISRARLTQLINSGRIRAISTGYHKIVPVHDVKMYAETRKVAK